MPESKRHFKLRTALYAILELALGKAAVLGSDQFVYWNAREPRRCLAPDVFVYVGRVDEDFPSWKCWERGGPPQLAIEIVSASDEEPIRWSEKLERYHELGVQELVRFDADADGGRIRVWDRITDDLVERLVEGDVTECLTLDPLLGAGVDWVAAPLGAYPHALRLRRAGLLLPTPEEEASAHAEQARAAAQRIAELEAELARRR